MDGGNAAEFLRSVEDLHTRVAGLGTAEAMGMAREARELGVTFRSWVKSRPDDAARVAAIQRLIKLNRRVMDYLAQRPRAR